jgi:hypothetical protein
MKPHEFPAGTQTGWILVTCALTFILFVILGGKYWLDRQHKHDVVLAHQMISEFHQDFNSIQEDAVATDSDRYVSMIEEVRSRTGKFKELGPCTVKRVEEPPYLTAECHSTFESGEEVETFIFHDYGQDRHLLHYSAVPIVRSTR